MAEKNKEKITEQNQEADKIDPADFKEKAYKSKDEKASFFKLLFQKYFYYILILQVVIIALAGYWFFLSDKISAISNYDVKVAMENQKIQAEISKYQKKINELDELKESYSRISNADISKINRILPDSKQEEELFVQIEKAVDASGILLDYIFIEEEEEETVRQRSKRSANQDSQETKKDSSASKEVKLRFAVSRVGYQSLKSLLTAMENNLRIIDIEEIDYSPEEGSAEFLIKSYYLPRSS